MSIIDETRAYLDSQKDKLRNERQRLIAERENINREIEEIDAFLKQLGSPAPKSTGTRRSRIRSNVLDLIKANPDGITPAEIRSALHLEGKAASQSVSNALAALKKQGAISMTSSGTYVAP